MIKKYYIQADLYNGEYDPTEISESLEKLTSNFEYGDVAEDNYQIWVFPSGEIYKVIADTTVSDKAYYSIAGSGWNPKLIQIGTNKALVNQAYKTLCKQNHTH